MAGKARVADRLCGPTNEYHGLSSASGQKVSSGTQGEEIEYLNQLAD